MNDNSFRDKVKSHASILTVIGDYTYIETGNDLKWKEGDCPLCDQHGKILVYPEEQIFKSPCCNQQGDVFTFVELKENVSYGEALILLANKFKVEIPKKLRLKETNGHTKMEDKTRRRMFGFFKRSIPYFKDLRKITGSVTASILMSQLEYWFEEKPDGFYKFLQSPEGGHPNYKPGDSWCEELAFSKEEFRNAFD